MRKMKKLFGILFLFTLLTSCANPVARYQNFMGDPENALVATAYDGFGIGAGEATIEHAVYAAFRTCEHYNPNDTCTLKQINGRVVSYSEAVEWRGRYNKNSKYLSYRFSNGGYKIINDTGKRNKETQTTQTTQTQTTQTQPTEPEKTESSGEEESLEETLNNVFGDRKLDRIEGLWGYQREGEKKARIYIIIKSEKYLYEEIVVFHPVEKFKDEVSTRIIKKINNNSYKVKGTWLNKNKKEWQRDGKITFMNKFKIRFEYKETCHTDDDCFEHHVYYKEKIWPPQTYTDDLGLDEEQTEKLKNLIE